MAIEEGRRLLLARGYSFEPLLRHPGHVFHVIFKLEPPKGCGSKRAKPAMNVATEDLPEVIRRQSEKIIAEIERGGSMVRAVKSGARANGFVLGLICAGGITADQGEALSEHFDQATEKRLKTLALGLF